MLGGQAIGCHTSSVLATKTFLFSDLRDYTRFVETHGDEAARTLIEDYRRIVRAEIAKHAGAEIKTEGDSFYVVFTNARAAMACGTGLLRDAGQYSADHASRPMRIGVGIHAGEPVPHEGQYVGSAVIVAARLAQVAKAGELLITDLVRGLLPRQGLPHLEERADLTLKGIEDQPRIFAVQWQAASTPRSASAAEVVIEAAAPTSHQVLCPIVVGRERERAALDSALAEVLAGRARTVLVSGEAGQGKTALLRDFATHARALGAQLLVGECNEIDARRPFGPFIDALTAAGIDLPAELSEGGPGAQLVAEAERYRMHSAFAERLVSASRERPLVMAVEDLHWADEATYELIPYLARKLKDARVLLLATYRSDELHRLHPINHVLAELTRGRLAEDVRLHKLTLEETGDVMRAALGLERPPTVEFRQALWERTEGNPFFIEEILRALVERGDLAYKDGGWRRTKDVADLAIPLSVREAVQQRLVTLDADARRVVQVAAIIGQRFQFDLIQEVSGLDEPTVLAGIKSAIDEQLVREEVDVEEESYAFRHALSRESVLAEMLQRERRLLHRAVGEAIERQAIATEAARSEELAYHFDQARDSAKAYRYHELAARASLSAFAFSRAVSHFERAIELAPDDDERLGELELRLADAAFLMADVPRALRAATEARSLSEQHDDRVGAGRATRQLSIYRWWLGETPAALELAREAVAILEPLGPTGDLALAYAELARLAMLRADLAEAMTWAERTLALARETGHVRAEVHALNYLGTARMNSGDRQGEPLTRASIALADQHGLVMEAQRAYQNLYAGLSRHVGEKELRAIHLEAMAHAQQHGVRFASQINREAVFAYRDGDWDRALRIVSDERDESIWSAARDMLSAIIFTAREGPEKGSPIAEAARRRLLAAGDPQWLANASQIAYVHYFAGEYGRTLDDLSDVVAITENALTLFPRFGEPLLVCAMAAAYLAGDDEALVRWTGLAARTRRAGQMTAAADMAAAFEQARAGDAHAAGAGILVALGGEMFTSFDPIGSACMREVAADLFLKAGDTKGAAAALAPAIAWWRGGRATWYLGRLLAWASERGIPVAANG